MARGRRQIYGVDFSGAANAGSRIWVARGVRRGAAMHIEACHPAADLPGSGKDRDRCLAALREFIRRERECAFGFDFPFGLAAELVEEGSWEDFVQAFPGRYCSPREFRESCRAAAGGRELRRITDRESRTPFSPYNLRVYRQTYFGIRDLLAPLVAAQTACVVPMQRALPGRPWLLEVCPASLLKREGFYAPYKGRSRQHRENRKRIAAAVERMDGVAALASGVREAALANASGDALDAILAAVATSRALRNPAHPTARRSHLYALEGYVYT